MGRTLPAGSLGAIVESMYKRPTRLTRLVVNGPIKLAVRLGLSPRGSQMLTVPGRKTGEPRTVPVNPLELDGATYLVAPRGNTNWSRNLRAAGEGELRVGRRRRRFRFDEIPDSEKLPPLRAYLERWEPETKSQFELGKDAPDEQLQEIAPLHPVFRLDFLD
jgi:deazaflavin-dependent oxidoreductase (nitroreductase family)